MKKHQLNLKEKISLTHIFFNKKYSNHRMLLSPTQQYVFNQISNLIPVGNMHTTAVDLGCHWGRYSKLLARTHGQVVGIDFAEDAIATAERAGNIKYVLLDLDSKGEELSRFAPVDCFLAVALFEMIKEPLSLCQQMYNAGGAGCRILIVIPNRFSINFILLRIALWIARTVFKKNRYIYNNGIMIKDLISYLTEAGFEIQDHASIVGIPVYLVDRLPIGLQALLLKTEHFIRYIFGGSYHWVLAKKP